MDKIILSGIELFARGGVSQAEKELGHRYRVDVELGTDLSTAARTDSLADTIDYVRVYGIVRDTILERAYNLVETVAVRTAERMLEELPAESATVRLTKLNPPIDGIVASETVEVTRGRRE